MILRSTNSVMERSLNLLYHLEALAVELNSKTAALKESVEAKEEETPSGQVEEEAEAVAVVEEEEEEPIVETEVAAEL